MSAEDGLLKRSCLTIQQNMNAIIGPQQKKIYETAIAATVANAKKEYLPYATNSSNKKTANALFAVYNDHFHERKTEEILKDKAVIERKLDGLSDKVSSMRIPVDLGKQRL